MKVELESKSLVKLQKLADKFPALSEKHVGKAIRRSLVRVFGAEKREAPVGVSGQLRDRWSIVTGRFEGALKSEVSYGVAVHDGTLPHRVSATAIAPWARKKGLNPWAVAKSISKKGTKANPFLKRAIDGEKRNIDKDFQTAIDEIGSEVTKAI